MAERHSVCGSTAREGLARSEDCETFLGKPRMTFYPGHGPRLAANLRKTSSFRSRSMTNKAHRRLDLNAGLKHSEIGDASSYLRSRLTLCITTKDRQADIDEQFRSLASLQLQSLAVRIIDDGSTIPIHLEAAAGFSDVQLIRHEVCVGPAECRNQLVANTRTPFVLSLDDDSELLADTGLVDILQEMEKHPEWAIVGYSILERRRGFPPPAVDLDRPVIIPAKSFVGCGCVVRCAAFGSIGSYTADLEYFGEERDFSMRAIACGYEIGRVINRYVAHYKSPVNRSSKRFSELTARNVPIIWLLNAPRRFRWVLYARSVCGILLLGVRRGWPLKSIFHGLRCGKDLYRRVARDPRKRLSYRGLWNWWNRI